MLEHGVNGFVVGNVSVESWRVFLLVVEHGSFSAAARQLHKVPSAISMMIANLEADLNLELFDRSRREPIPTAAARALLPNARYAIQQLQQLETHALSLSQGLESTLTLVVDPALLVGDWISVLGDLATAHPDLAVEVLAAQASDAMQLLHEGRAQLGLLLERPQMDNREGFFEIHSETFVAVMSPKHSIFVTQESINFDDLMASRQIVVASWNADEVDERFAMSSQIWRTDNYTSAVGLIQAGLGWGMLPRSMVRSYINSGSLVEIPLENLKNTMVLAVDMVWSKEQPMGLATRYILDRIGASYLR
ncbi:LysR family transcriptional regulator [Aquirhabdus parva]|uniref:LysR family transcriptional regulator n=1 Tax=Aquirhabdus parva TaxID=2283318 RepID=A0A345P3B7_9GAMM|nr:LysR family transcriptional regulator [Aquirhabdus parva]AXI01776.1 LysR family transcriptional regulator [Aquirhabdus parva]